MHAVEIHLLSFKLEWPAEAYIPRRPGVRGEKVTGSGGVHSPLALIQCAGFISLSRCPICKMYRCMRVTFDESVGEVICASLFSSARFSVSVSSAFSVSLILHCYSLPSPPVAVVVVRRRYAQTAQRARGRPRSNYGEICPSRHGWQWRLAVERRLVEEQRQVERGWRV